MCERGKAIKLFSVLLIIAVIGFSLLFQGKELQAQWPWSVQISWVTRSCACGCPINWFPDVIRPYDYWSPWVMTTNPYEIFMLNTMSNTSYFSFNQLAGPFFGTVSMVPMSGLSSLVPAAAMGTGYFKFSPLAYQSIVLPTPTPAQMPLY